MSPRRWLVCSACDGSKRGENGDICYECQGLGGSWYGEDRPLRDIEIDLESTRCYLETDLTERDRAIQNLDRCKPEQVATYQKQIKLVEENIAYWRAQIDGLEVEREAAERRGREAEQRADAKAYGDHASRRGPGDANAS